MSRLLKFGLATSAAAAALSGCAGGSEQTPKPPVCRIAEVDASHPSVSQAVDATFPKIPGEQSPKLSYQIGQLITTGNGANTVKICGYTDLGLISAQGFYSNGKPAGQVYTFDDHGNPAISDEIGD